MAEKRVDRRLAAILAADVVGYSRLIGTDEEGTLARINDLRRDFWEPKIAEHRGRIVRWIGDGVLIEFASVVGAARCAFEIQGGMDERNRAVPTDKRIFAVHAPLYWPSMADKLRSEGRFSYIQLAAIWSGARKFP